MQLYRSSFGLGSGGAVAVPANGAWNIGNGAVFLFESDSVNSDTLNSNAFADLNAIAFAVSTDNGAGSGSSAGRTVALVISNPETEAVLQGVKANQMAANAAIEIFRAATRPPRAARPDGAGRRCASHCRGRARA